MGGEKATMHVKGGLTWNPSAGLHWDSSDILPSPPRVTIARYGSLSSPVVMDWVGMLKEI